MMVGQHQTESRQVHDIGIPKPVAAAPLAQLQQSAGNFPGLCAPGRFDDREWPGKVPVGIDCIKWLFLADLVPVV